MSVQIRVSYQHDSELEQITDALAPMGLKCKVAEQKGYYKRAYFKDPEIDGLRYRDKRKALQADMNKYPIE